MTKLRFLLVFIPIFYSCDDQPRIILNAEAILKYDNDTTRLQLFSDNSFILKIAKNNKRPSKTEFGNYNLIHDTIYFDNSKHKIKAVLKNNAVEYLNRSDLLKLIVVQSEINIKNYLSENTLERVSIFSGSPKYIFGNNAIPHDLSQWEFENFERIANTCLKPKLGEQFQIENYFMQLLVAKNYNGEIIIWANCMCSKSYAFDYGLANISDGGPCFIKLKVNLSKNACFEVMINGY